MIKVTDLITWAKRSAVDTSINNPYGWVRGEDLEGLAKAVKKREPFEYAPTRRGLHESGGDGAVRL